MPDLDRDADLARHFARHFQRVVSHLALQVRCPFRTQRRNESRLGFPRFGKTGENRQSLPHIVSPHVVP